MLPEALSSCNRYHLRHLQETPLALGIPNPTGKSKTKFCLFFVLQPIAGDSSNSFSAPGILFFCFLLNNILLDDHLCFCSCSSTTQHCKAVSIHSLAKVAFLFWNYFLWDNWVKIMTSSDQSIALLFCKLFKHSNWSLLRSCIADMHHIIKQKLEFTATINL